jgi:hypothetical protein
LPKWDYVICHNDPLIRPDNEREISQKRKGITTPIQISFIGLVRFFEQNKKLLGILGNDERFMLAFYGQNSNALEEYATDAGINNVLFKGRFKPEETVDFYMKTDVINNYYGGFTSGVVTFENVYTTDWASFKGAAYSSMTDTVTEGYLDQYSVMAGQGALGSKQFALLFDDGASFRVNYEPGYDVQTLKSVMVCNGTYPYMEMREGGYCEKFTEGDFFKVTFKGYKGELSSGEVEYYLADFREGRRFLNNNWEYLDLTPLGDAERVEVVFDGSDKGEYGLNTPRYVFIDNLVVEQQR